MVAAIHYVTVGRTVAVGDPHPRAGPHHRFQRGHEPAGRHLHLNLLSSSIVNIGLPVGDDQDFVTGQMLVQNGLEAGRAPGNLAFIAHPAVGLQLAHQRVEILGDGVQLRGMGLPALSRQSLAGEHGPHAGHPTAPAEMRNEHRDR